MLSKREKALINNILIQNNYTFAHNLAEEMNVSTKTIYRIIKNINDLSPKRPLINSESGKGYSIDYDLYLSLYLCGGEYDPQIPKNRRDDVTLILLKKSPGYLHIEELFNRYHLSESAIYKDFQIIEDFITDFSIKLDKKQDSVALLGNEKDVRKAIATIINRRSNSEETIELFNTYDDKDIDLVTELIDYIETQIGNTFDYPYNVNIISHLYILIVRLRNNADNTRLVHDALDAEDAKFIEDNKEIYKLASHVIKDIESYLHTNIDTNEVFYLMQFIYSSRMLSVTQNENTPDQDEKILKVLIEEMEKILKINIKDYSDLEKHFSFFLYRVRNEVIISNSIIAKIKHEYKFIFDSLQTVLDKLKNQFSLPYVSDDEIGFLAVYFAKYKELYKPNHRILIVCSTGVGTSELLQVKVKRNLNNVEIVDTISYRRFTKEGYDFDNIDLILTTINIGDIDLPVPCLLVSALFTELDRKMVEERIMM